ncbi:MAG TPA: helicase C-terminal domain-containing protein [Aggregatilineales bacterium]|nr:helicase C-terminal domain-containing protein [Aggregatilineales bacterium]
MRGVLIALDLETTGLDSSTAQIIEIGIVKFQGHEVLEQYRTFVDPERQIPPRITAITGITQDDVRGAPKLADVLPHVVEMVGMAPVIGHNVEFDMRFLQRAGILQSNDFVDTYELASVLMPTAPRYNLNALMQELHLQPDGSYHRALADAVCTAQVYMKLWDMLVSDLPVALIQEIVSASEMLPWRARSVFADALQVRSEVEGITAPPSSKQELPGQKVASLTNLVTREMPPMALNVENVVSALDAGGAVASEIAGYAVRPAQVTMAQAVAEAFNQNEHLLIEAPAGTGRGLAYLLPAAHWASQNEECVVLATSTESQAEQLLKREIPMLRMAFNQELPAVRLRDRSSYLCPRRLDALRRRLPTSIDELRVFAKVEVWRYQSPTGDSRELSLRGPAELNAWAKLTAADEECTLDRCESRMGGICPFYQAFRAARSASIVITDHSFLLTDSSQPAEAQLLPAFSRVIVDEVHSLEDMVTFRQEFHLDAARIARQIADLGTGRTGMLGDMVNSTRDVVPDAVQVKIRSFVKMVTSTTGNMQHHVDHLFESVRSFLEAVNELKGTDFIQQVRLTENLRNKAAFSQVKASWAVLSQFIEGIEEAITKLADQLRLLRDRYPIPYIDDLLDSAVAAARHLRTLYRQLDEIIVRPEENIVYWIELSADSEALSLHGGLLNVGTLFKRNILDNRQTVVMTGSALRAAGSFEFIRHRLQAEDINEIALPSRFDYEHSTLIYLPTDLADPNERNKYQQNVQQAIIELAAVTEGRLLALFTGYTQLRQVAQYIAPRLALGNIAVFDQSDGTSRQALLEGFKNANRAVLLGTRSLWDDLDLSASDLVSLVIVRLPFAVPSDPIYAARAETYDNSFNQYTMPDAILRFRQGFDRLTRARTDRAIVTILDKRMTSKEYGQMFLDSLPPCTVRRSPLAELGPAAKAWVL